MGEVTRWIAQTARVLQHTATGTRGRSVFSVASELADILQAELRDAGDSSTGGCDIPTAAFKDL